MKWFTATYENSYSWKINISDITTLQNVSKKVSYKRCEDLRASKRENVKWWRLKINIQNQWQNQNTSERMNQKALRREEEQKRHWNKSLRRNIECKDRWDEDFKQRFRTWRSFWTRHQRMMRWEISHNDIKQEEWC